MCERGGGGLAHAYTQFKINIWNGKLTSDTYENPLQMQYFCGTNVDIGNSNGKNVLLDV